MALFLTTTGVDVDIVELGYTIVHPTTDFEISAQFNSAELKLADSLTSAITAGTLIWRKTAGGADEIPGDYDPDYEEVYQENTGGFADDRAVTFKDLFDGIAVSAAPSYSFGNNGNVNNAWLLRVGGAPSNKTGAPFSLFNGVLIEVNIAAELPTTATIEIYHHLGNEEALTLLTSFTMPNTKTFKVQPNLVVPTGVQLAVRALGQIRNPGADLQLTGTRVP